MAKKSEWIGDVADKVVKDVTARGAESDEIVCASGISPSGPIHIGNLRELMTVHLVCEELIRRGYRAVHIHSWDDYDRFRKVPVGVPASYEQHLGKPICDVPDPEGEFDSYAERFMVQFEQHVARLGIRPRYIRQSRAYRAGTYDRQIKMAIEQRKAIFDILAKYQTEGRHSQPIEERREEYCPYNIYCQQCGTDRTRFVSFDSTTDEVTYRCACSDEDRRFRLGESSPGKLAWKVDWPMRWAHEGVDFEPGGEDHATAGSSYTVGREIVRSIYDGHPPTFVKYAFVGIAGRTKMSSSEGMAPTPEWALRFLEPAMIRWLYIRRKCSDQFEINFGQNLWRLYDEWDRFVAKATSADATDSDKLMIQRCTRTTTDEVVRSAVPIPFRLLSSAADMTNGNRAQIIRIVRTQDPDLKFDEADIEPRLSCAIDWATECLPEDERTKIRDEFCEESYAQIPETSRECIEILLRHLRADLSFEELTSIIYGAPKMQLGLPLDAEATPEVKQRQRQFFVAIYQLVCDSDTGPRLPTLFLSIGLDRIRSLLSPVASDSVK